jgi:primosomal protein N' (replication factor Y) (superfamily II helicase)
MTEQEESLSHATLFAELILPVPVPKLFTYRIPRSFNDTVKAGQRAIVQFGQRKILTGIIHTLHHTPPKEYEAKSILELLDESEIIYGQQFRLYEWMANYYMCTWGEVLNAALPSGLKLSSESMVQIHPAFNEEETTFDFSEKERILLSHLQQKAMSYTEVAKLLDAKSIYSLIKSLVSKEAILLFEEVKEKFKPRTEKYIRLSAPFTNKKRLEALFAELETKPKQEAVVLKYLQEVPVFSNVDLNLKGLPKAKLLDADLSESSLRTLIKQHIFEEFDIVVPRFGFSDVAYSHSVLLSEKQEHARNSILKHFESKEVVLLQGVTGSGKTEIYIDLIKRALESGSQALYLLPEIALTTQIVQRLKKVFGSEMGVYHSKFSDNERVEVWNGVLKGKFRFVVGVRSSIFLPFDNLGLIIVDEEHDSSYKQHDPAPRYHARDVAMVIGQIHHAKVILGSATPSAESYYQATRDKYGWVTLGERFGEAQLPDITLADLHKEKQRKTNKGEFTSLLLNEIKDTIGKEEQVIIFQNRRGHSPMVQCEDCSWIPKCINCAVSLTYHQYRHALVCHYCGYREDLPTQCPTCSSRRILTLGYGTERLEEELKLHFPDTKIQRMDLDTTRSKSGYETIIEEFESGETKILVGTQMVSKGLDFNKVNLVGVFNADRMMHFPDFRSYERSFQLITQVSGRSGRREKKGKVVIQTSNVSHPLFSFIIQHDVNGFLTEQLHDRQNHFFPPFCRLIEITIKHVDKKTGQDAARILTDDLRSKLKGIKILGPGEPSISKIRNEYLMTILIKIARDQGNLGTIKSILSTASQKLTEEKSYRSVKIVFDVDPV